MLRKKSSATKKKRGESPLILKKKEGKGQRNLTHRKMALHIAQ